MNSITCDLFSESVFSDDCQSLCLEEDEFSYARDPSNINNPFYTIHDVRQWRGGVLSAKNNHQYMFRRDTEFDPQPTNVPITHLKYKRRKWQANYAFITSPRLLSKIQPFLDNITTLVFDNISVLILHDIIYSALPSLHSLKLIEKTNTIVSWRRQKNVFKKESTVVQTLKNTPCFLPDNIPTTVKRLHINQFTPTPHYSFPFRQMTQLTDLSIKFTTYEDYEYPIELTLLSNLQSLELIPERKNLFYKLDKDLEFTHALFPHLKHLKMNFDSVNCVFPMFRQRKKSNNIHYEVNIPINQINTLVKPSLIIAYITTPICRKIPCSIPYPLVEVALSFFPFDPAIPPHTIILTKLPSLKELCARLISKNLVIHNS